MMNEPFTPKNGAAIDMSKPAYSRVLFNTLIATLILFVLLILSAGSDGISNADDTMRLISLRDLAAGQNWFDLMQYRLGPDGVLMHWSRLVDAPIWLIFQIGMLISGNAAFAEKLVYFAWPAATLFLAFLAVGYACRRLHRADMLLPSMVIAGACFMAIGAFGPGALDHHNIQIALCLWMLALLMPISVTIKSYAIAGIVSVLMLAIGMETLPYVTVAGIFVAVAFLLGWVSPKVIGAFGWSFGLTSLAIFVITVPPESYARTYCDAYSLFHIGMCSVGGFGLALCSYCSQSFKVRLMGIVATGALAVLVLVTLFPQCLSNPLSSLDPVLIELWLERVIETRSLSDLISTDPFALFGLYGMSLMGVGAICFLYKNAPSQFRQTLLLNLCLLFIAIGVTAWQQRGMIFSSTFAILPLAYLVCNLYARYRQSAQTSDLLKMASVGFLSLNVLWWITGQNLSSVFSSAPTLQEQAGTVSKLDFCQTEESFSALAAEPKGVVLSSTNIGSNILKFTHHSALAGPYHRNIDGNLATITALLAKPDDAEAIIRNAGATLIADCVADADPRAFRAEAPEGLQAALHKGAIPDYLELIENTHDDPLVLYRVKNRQ